MLGDDVAAELDRLRRPRRQHDEAGGEVLGQRVEEVERRRVGGVDVVDHEQRFVVAPTARRSAARTVARGRLAAGDEQLGQHGRRGAAAWRSGVGRRTADTAVAVERRRRSARRVPSCRCRPGR